MIVTESIIYSERIKMKDRIIYLESADKKQKNILEDHEKQIEYLKNEILEQSNEFERNKTAEVNFNIK